MTETPRYATDWLTLPDLVEILGEPLGRVRCLLDDSYLIGSRRDGVLRVPSVETIDWLLTPEETIGVAPIEALRAGRKSEVRRVAATLA